MAKIEIEIPDEILLRANWYIENLREYNNFNDFFMTAILSSVDMCNDITRDIKKPFTDEFYSCSMGVGY